MKFKFKDKNKAETDTQAGAFTVLDAISPASIERKSKDYVIADGVYHSYLYVAGYGYPTKVSHAWLSHLVEAGEGVNLSFILKRQPKEKTLNKIAQVVMVNRSRMRDVGDTRSDFEELDSAIDAGLYLKDGMNRARADFYYMHTIIEITADDENTLEQRISMIETRCVSNDMLCKRCDFKQAQAFTSCLPTLTIDSDIERKTRRNVLTDGAAAAFPFSSFEICDQEGIMLGINQNNSSVAIVDIFDSTKYSNANMSVMGMSGSGKTFLLQLMALRLRMQDTQIFIIAPLKGMEFRPACEAIGGKYIKLSPSSNDCINVMEIRKTTLDTDFEIGELEDRDDSILADKIQKLHIFFSLLKPDITVEELDDEASRFTAVIGTTEGRHLRNMRNIADVLYEMLYSEPVLGNGGGKRSQVLWELANLREQLAALARHVEQVCWLEMPDINSTEGNEQEILLSAIPKNLDERLFKDLWNKRMPTILTSGTLSAGGDFSHIKRTLGLERLGTHVTETSKPSPFNHKENALLYISENMPFPDNKSDAYIAAVADEVERLITASHGHAAVLFTSYKVMDKVWERIAKRNIQFPMFRLDKGGVMEIERFKQSGNGVLFASGALWEGIDIPGDALSMLIIVKLPFAVPDPIGEYEQTLYRDMFEYKNRVIVPEMLIKLKQGFGRLIRMESDTGIVAILDSRANLTGAYRSHVLSALPVCRVTSKISEVSWFYRAKKTAEYFIKKIVTAVGNALSQVGTRR